MKKDKNSNSPFPERRNIVSRLLCRKQLDPQEEELQRVYVDKFEFIRGKSGLREWLHDNKYDEETSDEIVGTFADVAVSLDQVSKIITDSPKKIEKLLSERYHT